MAVSDRAFDSILEVEGLQLLKLKFTWSVFLRPLEVPLRYGKHSRKPLLFFPNDKETVRLSIWESFFFFFFCVGSSVKRPQKLGRPGISERCLAVLIYLDLR